MWPRLSPSHRRILLAIPSTTIGAVSIFAAFFPDQFKSIWTADNWNVKAPHAKRQGQASPPYVVRGLALLMGCGLIGGLFIKESRPPETDPGHLGELEFTKRYAEALCEAVLTVPYIPKFVPGDRSKAIVNLLKNVIAVAASYKSDSKAQNLSLNACLYIPRSSEDLSKDQLEQVKPMMDLNRTSYSVFLELAHWAEEGATIKPCVPTGFVLPVDSVEEYTLFGAPLAFISNSPQSVQTLAERSLKKLSGMQHHSQTRKAVLSFFSDRKSYQSFVCIPVAIGPKTADNKVLGVISIQSKQRKLCHVDSDDGKNMLTMLEPFIVTIALVLKERNSAATEKQNDV